MSEHDEPDTPEDEALRRRLGADMPDPSKAHDSSILAAARAFASEPSPERQNTLETLHVPAPVAPERTPRWAMAAAILVTAGIGAMVLLGTPPVDDTVRGAGIVVVPANDAELTSTPEGFVLPRSADALGCRVTLRDESGASIWTSDVFSSGQVDLVDEVRAQIGAGDFSWQASCRGAGSQTFGPYRFSVTTPTP